MQDTKERTAVQGMIGEADPKLEQLTEDVLYGDVWARPELSPRDRSLITVASLITGGNFGQLGFHLGKARDNGLTETELTEAVTHLAFYAGWPKAVSALAVTREVFER